MKIYHNPRCSKSRAGLAYLEEKGYDITVIKYLDDRFTEQELKEVIAASGKKPFDFVRTQEKEYKEIYRDKTLSDEEWIKVLVENPKLLQRPIVVNGKKAVLAIPPEAMEEII